MKLIKELLENPKWKDKMCYKPHMMFVDKECTEQIFNEQWTCDWLIKKYVRHQRQDTEVRLEKCIKKVLYSVKLIYTFSHKKMGN